MKKKIIYTIIFSVMLGAQCESFALERTSQGLLSMFSRYESEFSNNKRRLEEYARKMDSAKGKEYDDLLLDAETLVGHVQNRYEIIEDQYTFNSSEYPGDRAALREGFETLEDKYREIMEIYSVRIKEGKRNAETKSGTKFGTKSENLSEKRTESVAKSDLKILETENASKDKSENKKIILVNI